MNADGSAPRALLATQELEQPAGWSPDGKTILFTRYLDRSGRRAEVGVVAVDGSGERMLARGIAASWSPDGERILYTNPFQPYEMAGDGTQKRRITAAPAFDPDWR